MCCFEEVEWRAFFRSGAFFVTTIIRSFKKGQLSLFCFSSFKLANFRKQML
eukprot:UN02740